MRVGSIFGLTGIVLDGLAPRRKSSLRWAVPVVTLLALVGLPLYFGAEPPIASAQLSTRGVVDESVPRVPGEIVVRFKNRPSLSEARATTAEHGLVHAKTLDVIGLNLLRSDPGDEIAAIRRLQNDPRVEFAEPNYRTRALLVPTDASYPSQYDM